MNKFDIISTVIYAAIAAIAVHLLATGGNPVYISTFSAIAAAGITQTVCNVNRRHFVQTAAKMVEDALTLAEGALEEFKNGAEPDEPEKPEEL